MSEIEQLLVKHEEEENVDPITDRVDPHSTGTVRSDQLAKVGIGVVLGAVAGAVAGALVGKVTVENVNNTVKSVGDAVKGAAEGVNHTVKGVGDAIKSVAENVNHTVKDVGDAVQGAAEDVNHNVKGTVGVVKGAAEGVNHTVKGTVDAVKGAAENVNHTVKGTVDAAYEERLVADEKQAKTGEVGIEQLETQTTYILVPVDKQRVVERTIPLDSRTPLAPGEADFHIG
jgi:phage-related protein